FPQTSTAPKCQDFDYLLVERFRHVWEFLAATTSFSNVPPGFRHYQFGPVRNGDQPVFLLYTLDVLCTLFFQSHLVSIRQKQPDPKSDALSWRWLTFKHAFNRLRLGELLLHLSEQALSFVRLCRRLGIVSREPQPVHHGEHRYPENETTIH